ncbi:Uncharacterized protein APZ42_009641 [Daphnia magna]|uniref:Uncharacterized protein n=1 Tax=Daphnia magna TaxID=35525 RepID=A0A164DWG2_9CRUS|nr:Uncharacterized protein APZ42_009641 [Daphnia magna]
MMNEMSEVRHDDSRRISRHQGNTPLLVERELVFVAETFVA